MGTIPGTNGGTVAVASEELASALVGEIEGVPDGGRWLIEKLWSAGGVGIVGGTPKTGKTWMSLEFAVSVASGAPALGRFAVAEPAPVVVFPPEDDPRAVRDRGAGIAKHKGLELEGLPLHLITARALRLDEEGDRRGLCAMLERIKPKLVVLDPLVRLHGGDENHLGHIAQLLSFLRELQRDHGCAILLTHHVAKRRGGKGAQLGQALRGSGELHAWGDSNVYLTRTEDGLVRMTLEHRAAASPEPFFVTLRSDGGGGAYFEVVEGVEIGEEPGPDKEGEVHQPRATAVHSLRDRVLGVLRAADEPVSQARLREVVRVRNQRLTEVLHELSEAGLVERPGGKRRWMATREAADVDDE